MPRKLKTFTTSIGFYDLAIAAPSMKAALEAWGTKQNLFHEGLAQETAEESIVAATVAYPGVVLRRPVGTKGIYKERPDAPQTLPADARARAPKAKPKAKPKPPRKADNDKQPKATVIEFEVARKHREAERKAEEAREKAAAASQDAKRLKAIEKAKAKRSRALKQHEAKLDILENGRKALDDEIEAERLRWVKERKTLDANVRNAGGLT